jgi:hypothetical protein
VREAHARLLAEDYLGARARRKLPVAAHEVRVKVRLDDVLNLQPFGSGLFDVLVNVALRVDDRGLAVRADEIRRVRETAEVELLEVHRRRLLSIFPRTDSIPPRPMRTRTEPRAVASG